jgi:hypothetical protein
MLCAISSGCLGTLKLRNQRLTTITLQGTTMATIYKGFQCVKIITSDRAKRFKATWQGTRLFAATAPELQEKIDSHIFSYR